MSRQSALKAYLEALVPLDKAYEEAIVPAQKSYGEALSAAWIAYQEAMAPAKKAYEQARAAVRKAYQEESPGPESLPPFSLSLLECLAGPAAVLLSPPPSPCRPSAFPLYPS